ncbi:MAG: OmpH family outer membrane protein [Candidatus Sedimenticola sp. 6PFRAG5]
MASAEELKIGVVNPNKLVEKSPQYDAVRKELETEFKRRNEDLIAKQKQLKKLEDKLTRDSAVMSSSEVKRLEQDIRSRKRQLNNTRDEYREDLNLRRSEEFNKLLRHVSEVVHQVAAEEKLDLVLSQGVVYASSRVDLTNRVLDRLKAQVKSGDGK